MGSVERLTHWSSNNNRIHGEMADGGIEDKVSSLERKPCWSRYHANKTFFQVYDSTIAFMEY